VFGFNVSVPIGRSEIVDISRWPIHNVSVPLSTMRSGKANREMMECELTAGALLPIVWWDENSEVSSDFMKWKEVHGMRQTVFSGFSVECDRYQ
jgi:hypothetical protein